MCGIIGIISTRPFGISHNLAVASKQMQRRGPDDEGFCLFKNESVDICYSEDTPVVASKDGQAYYPSIDIKSTFDQKYKVGLAHRRLSILDLSPHGHQPMCDQTQRYWIVFNGEIYNFKEIRDELKKSGHCFISETDTEVILKAFIHWGEECLEKFNGMFAFAIFDRYNNKLFVARDRIGIKPLYFYKSDDSFIFASDIKTILATGLVKAEVDKRGLYQNFAFGITPRPNTSFKNIYSVKQATYLWLDAESLEISEFEYWDVPTNIQDLSLTEEDSTELLESELQKSIKYQLNSDVEVGTFMSGGIDSTTISAVASRLHPGIKAFTLGFDKSISQYDETKQAIATARQNDIEHIVSFLSADVVLNNIEDMVLGYEEPFYHLAANYAISEIVAKHGVKVVFNGLGGDELFAGYATYDRWLKLQKLGKFRWFAGAIPVGLSRKVDRLKQIAKVRDPIDFYTQSYMKFSDKELQDLFGFNCNAKDELKRLYLKSEKEFTDDVELFSYLDIKHYIGNHHVHRVDQFTMAHSIEGRFPLLDHNLVEVAARIPTKYKINNGTQKKVLRNVAAKYIAPSCLSMKKKGFGLPLQNWYKNELSELACDSLSDLKKRQIFNEKAVDAVSDKGSVTHRWQLVMTELWLQKFIDGRFQ